MALHRLSLEVDRSTPPSSQGDHRSQCEHGLLISIDGVAELERWDGSNVAANSLLQESSPLIPSEDGVPAVQVVRWCSCGEVGCGSLAVVIRRVGSTIVWSDFRDDPSGRAVAGIGPFTFDADDYEREVRRAHRERDWETRELRVARLLGERLDDLIDPTSGAEWVTTRATGEITVAVMQSTSPSAQRRQRQRLGTFRIPDGDDGDAVAQVERLIRSTPPEDWTVAFEE